MDRKKELKMQYKETAVKAGVYEIKNTKNGKRFIGSTSNLKTLNGVKFMLENGSHTNKELQKDWTAQGAGVFEVNVLEEVKEQNDPLFNLKKELERLEEKWLDKVQPFEEQRYNTKKIQH
ncbi:GIY-YIG nuclease family protein [Planococcus sp. YIM B11945]|uniref:GIY-YIG nuclease family protein n=1 Tax=Planococcus sp. YIM B11945 TaxID=3435410 RepID=UPI003D7DAFD9